MTTRSLELLKKMEEEKKGFLSEPRWAGISGIATIIGVIVAVAVGFINNQPVKEEYKVQLQIPLSMKNAMVFVDGEQAEIIDQSNSIISLKLRSKESRHRFVVEADDKTCELEAQVVRDDQIFTLCEYPQLPSKQPQESKSIKLSKDIGLRSSPDAEEPAYCLLKATDYVLPLKVVKSLNEVWCKISVVDSRNCNEGDEGFIRPQFLSTSCISAK